MIVVDSSVWIAHFRNTECAEVEKLRNIRDPKDILVGDIILLELLQGARDERHATAIEQNLLRFETRPVLNRNIAVQAARNYRKLREKGVTIRKTADLFIGTFCIEGGHALLHRDRDFDAMEIELGLLVL